jgi:hypothetical protein
VTDRWQWSENLKRWERESAEVRLVVYPSASGYWRYTIYVGGFPMDEPPYNVDYVTQFRAMREADRHGWKYLNERLNHANAEATMWARAVANYRSGT